MLSLYNVHSIIFAPFKPVDPRKIGAMGQDRAIESDQARKFELLLGKNTKDQGFKAKLQEYCRKYEANTEIRKYLFGDNSLPDSRVVAWAKSSIEDAFGLQNRKYNYFESRDPKALELYATCYKLCEYQAIFVESSSLEEVGARAYKIMVLFSPDDLATEEDNASYLTKNLDKFVKSHMSSKASPIHDIGMHDLPRHDPESSQFDFTFWKSKLSLFGYELIKHFSDIETLAEYIKQAQRQDGDLEVDDNSIPQSKAALKHLIDKSIYGEGEDYAKLVQIYKFYNVPKNIYARTLELIRKGNLKISDEGDLVSKEEEFVPDVVVEITSDKYYLVKLPSNNLRGLVLGHISDCCQSVGGEEENSTLQGVTMSSSGFYVFIKVSEKDFDADNIDWDNFEVKDGRPTGNRIIGQSYVWKGANGGLVLDSIEILEGFGKELDIANTLDKLFRGISGADTSITRLMIGKGGSTTYILEQNGVKLGEAKTPENQVEGAQCYDSREQYEFRVCEALEVMRGELEALSGREHNHVICLEQGKAIKSLGKEMLQDLVVMPDYQLWTDAALLGSCVNRKDVQDYISTISRLELEQSEKYKCVFAQGDNAYHLSHNNFLNIKLLLARGYVTIRDIETIPLEQLVFLTSSDIMDLYSLGVKPRELIGDTIEDTKKQILKTIARLICNEAVDELSYIDDLELEVIDVLIQYHQLYAEHGLKISELSKLALERLEGIFSYNVQEIYRMGSATPNDIIGLDSEKIETLTSYDAQKAYKDSFVTLSELKDHDVDKILLLLSHKAIGAYKTYYVRVADLLDCTTDQIETLISDEALDAYRSDGVQVKDLKGCDPEAIEDLISGDAIYAYTSGFVTFAQLKQIEDKEKFFALISYDAISCYVEGHTTFDELKDLEVQKIPVLTSYEARAAYETKGVHITELQDFVAVAQIELLVSSQAVALYSRGVATYRDLVDVSEELLNVLCHQSSALLYTHQVFAKDIIAEDVCATKIKILKTISSRICKDDGDKSWIDILQENIVDLMLKELALHAYQNGDARVSDLRDLDEDGINLLLEISRYNLYQEFNLNASDIRHLEKEKLALFCHSADCRVGEAYKKGYLTIEDIAELPIDKIKSLTSYNALSAYGEGYISFSTLKEYTISEIEKYLKVQFVRLCGQYKVELADLVTLSPQDLDKLEKALHAAKYIELKEVIALSEDEIGVFCSHQMIEGYSAGTFTFQDVRQIEKEKLELLTSFEAIRIYKTSEFKLVDFIDFEPEEIALLTQDHRLIEAYKLSIKPTDILGSTRDAVLKNALRCIMDYFAANVEGKSKFFDNLGMETIEILMSEQMVELYYGAGEEFFVRLVNVSLEKLSALISLQAQRAYTSKAFTLVELADLEINEIEFLTSHRVVQLCQNAFIKVSDLIGVGRETAKFLVSQEAVQAYKNDYVKASDLKGLKIEIAKILVSCKALVAYHTGMVTVSDLREYNEEGIESFLSDSYLSLYRAGLKFESIKDCEEEKISLINSDNVLYLCRREYMSLPYLACVELDVVRKLISPDAQRCYQTRYIKAKDIEHASVEIMKAVSEWSAVEAYKAGYIKPTDIVTLSVDMIRTILSRDVQEFCKKHQIEAKDLASCDKEKIEFLVSIDRGHNYDKKFIPGILSPEDLFDIDLNMCKVITESKVTKALETKLVKVGDLKDFSNEIIPKLVSQAALTAYRSGLIKVEDLAGCEISKDTIDLLFTSSALFAYKHQVTTPAELAVLPREQIIEKITFGSAGGASPQSTEHSETFAHEAGVQGFLDGEVEQNVVANIAGDIADMEDFL